MKKKRKFEPKMKILTDYVPGFGTEKELRKWCIEQAISWQWDAGTAGYGLASGGQMPRHPSWPNILERAEQIYNWIINSQVTK